MSYRINPYVDEQNHYRCHGPERHYVEQLEGRGGLIRLDNVLVDAEQLVLRSFQCDPTWCTRVSGEGRDKKYKGCCCTDLEVDLTPEEIARMQKLGELAQQRLELGARDPMRDVAKRLAADNFMETTEKGERAIAHLPSGRCPIGFIERDGAFRCGLNKLCGLMELPLTDYKPEPCFLFPLHFVEHQPGVYLLTVVSEQSHEYIGAHVYVTKLRCLRKPQPGAPPAFISLRYEITHCFGEAFYAALAREARRIMEREGMAEGLAALEAMEARHPLAAGSGAA